MARRALVVVALSLATLANAAPATAAKPALKNACKLVTNDEIKELMGRKPVSKSGATAAGCVWTTRRMVPGDFPVGRNAEAAGVTLSGYKRLADAKTNVEAFARAGGCGEPDKFLPSRNRDLGDEAYLVGCNSNITFRVGHIVGEVNTYTNDVKEESSADTRRTAALTRIFVKRLRRYRCGSFCI
jgi:hypothetical protein